MLRDAQLRDGGECGRYCGSRERACRRRRAGCADEQWELGVGKRSCRRQAGANEPAACGSEGPASVWIDLGLTALQAPWGSVKARPDSLAIGDRRLQRTGGRDGASRARVKSGRAGGVGKKGSRASERDRGGGRPADEAGISKQRG